MWAVCLCLYCVFISSLHVYRCSNLAYCILYSVTANSPISKAAFSALHAASSPLSCMLLSFLMSYMRVWEESLLLSCISVPCFISCAAYLICCFLSFSALSCADAFALLYAALFPSVLHAVFLLSLFCLRLLRRPNLEAMWSMARRNRALKDAARVIWCGREFLDIRASKGTPTFLCAVRTLPSGGIIASGPWFWLTFLYPSSWVVFAVVYWRFFFSCFFRIGCCTMMFRFVFVLRTEKYIVHSHAHSCYAHSLKHQVVCNDSFKHQVVCRSFNLIVSSFCLLLCILFLFSPTHLTRVYEYFHSCIRNMTGVHSVHAFLRDLWKGHYTLYSFEHSLSS